MDNREEGYYWVTWKPSGKRKVARWKKGMWWITGYKDPIVPDIITNINENRIKEGQDGANT